MAQGQRLVISRVWAAGHRLLIPQRFGLCWHSESHSKSITSTSPRSVAESGRPSFPPSATEPCSESAVDAFGRYLMRFHIRTIHLASLSGRTWCHFLKLNPCPSNRCHKWTILVHLLPFRVSLLLVLQAKKDLLWSQSPVTTVNTTLQYYIVWVYIYNYKSGHSRRNDKCIGTLSYRWFSLLKLPELIT